MATSEHADMLIRELWESEPFNTTSLAARLNDLGIPTMHGYTWSPHGVGDRLRHMGIERAKLAPALMAELVRMRDQDGASYERLAAFLNAQGHLTPYGRPWVRGTVRFLFKQSGAYVAPAPPILLVEHNRWRGLLHDEWDAEANEVKGLNERLDPGHPRPLTIGLDVKPTWCCQACGCRWESSIVERVGIGGDGSRGVGCPCCTGRIVTPCNSLASRRSDLLRYWDADGNGSLRPADVHFTSPRRVRWRCPELACGHRWSGSVVRATNAAHPCRRCYPHGARGWKPGNFRIALREFVSDGVPDLVERARFFERRGMVWSSSTASAIPFEDAAGRIPEAEWSAFARGELSLVDRLLYDRSKRAPRSRGYVSRKRLFALDLDLCQRCGSVGPLDADHYKPLADGGNDSSWNLWSLCEACNGSKSGTPPERYDHALPLLFAARAARLNPVSVEAMFALQRTYGYAPTLGLSALLALAAIDDGQERHRVADQTAGSMVVESLDRMVAFAAALAALPGDVLDVVDLAA